MKNPCKRPPVLASLALCLAAISSAPAQDGRQTAPLPKAQTTPAVDVPKIRYTDFTLPNGLRVLLHEDHSSPIVSVELWYNVGSKDEAKGKTGLAHYFEHMMFEGSVNVPEGEYKRTILAAGGSYNAVTQNDFTRYWAVVPSNYLETTLWLEAERMANLSPTINESRFKLEREAVFNEYRDRILNVAVMSAGEAMFEGMFPNGGVYSSPLFGYHADLQNETVEDLRKFYATYYVPNNAVLVLAGDLTVADARKKIEKHFSPIPRGKPVPRVPAVTPLRGETRLVVEHPSGVRQLWFGWRGASSAAPDRPAAMALSSILTDRLRRLLVDDRHVAITLNPNYNQNFDQQGPGILQVAITPTATASATEVERLADSVMTALKTDGVTPTEVLRWVNGYRLSMLASMQTVQTKANYLADATVNAKDPMGNFGIVERAQHLSVSDVNAAARKYLTGDRVILSVVPTGKLELMSHPELPYTNATRKGGT